jgi:hypothetical protein
VIAPHLTRLPSNFTQKTNRSKKKWSSLDRHFEISCKFSNIKNENLEVPEKLKVPEGQSCQEKEN